MNSLSTKRGNLLLVALAATMLWSACRDDSPAQLPPSIIITVPPEPISTVLPGCEAGEVEAWFEVADWLMNTFATDSRSAMRNEPGAMGPAISRLADLRDSVASQPVPECVSVAHSTILSHMRNILTLFEQYATGNLSGDDMRAQVGTLLDELDTGVTQLLGQTQADLEEQLRIQRATQEAAAGP